MRYFAFFLVGALAGYNLSLNTYEQLHGNALATLQQEVFVCQDELNREAQAIQVYQRDYAPKPRAF